VRLVPSSLAGGVAAAVAAVALAGCVRLGSPTPPDAAAAERALLSAQELVVARSLAYRSVVAEEDVGQAWRTEREGDERAGVDPTAIDRAVTVCAGGPAPDVSVDSPTFVQATANEDLLVATQDSARGLASVYRDAGDAGTAFATYATDRWASCVDDALRGVDGESKVIAMEAGPIPRLGDDDDDVAGTRFTAVYDVGGAPVGVYLDVVVTRHERVVSVLELSSVNRPFLADVRADLLAAVRARMATSPPA
jgi:hypothetical protein